MSVAAKEMSSAPMHKIEAAPVPERYARGWHCLGAAADYKDGKPHSLDIFGTRLVVFQGEDGKLRILNAYCPHMGADLGIGKVDGNDIVCHFHGWKWGGDGKCKAIPYAKTIPPKARTQAWHTCEENNMLFVWNDPEGKDPDPELAIPHMPECFSDEWSGWSMVKWEINNNVRELIDNVADMAHFGPVHGGAGTVYFANIFEKHIATQIMVGSFENLGGKDDFLTTVATYYGPAYQITHMFGQMGGYPVESYLLNSHTPVNTEKFELRFGVMVKKFPGMTDEACDGMVKQYVDMTNQAFEQDVQVWHNKVRIDNPLVCDGDGPIAQNRQWYEQFYVNRADVPEKLSKRKFIEMNMGIQDDKKPPAKHALEA